MNQSLQTRKILLTGSPACGKTTIIRKVLENLERPASGFYTREIREQGKRVGFELVTLDGQTGMLAHLDFAKTYQVGPFGVDLTALEAIAIPAVLRGFEKGNLLILDEIGPMEIFSKMFCDAGDQIMSSDVLLLGTIVYRSVPYADKIKARNDIELIHVNNANRDSLAEEILGIIKNQ
ncbi:MAG: nucleoside-triphosphatase [Anaerolineaceae bacterium]|nr:nucleoside-triphosphatase [Anaerolineaceae bacterium]